MVTKRKHFLAGDDSLSQRKRDVMIRARAFYLFTRGKEAGDRIIG